MGNEPEAMLVQFRERGGSETRWSRIKAKPVREADGSVRLAINVIEDVTELKQVEQAQRFLAEASRVLADSLDYEATLAAIARLAVPGVADWCGVDLVADERRGPARGRRARRPGEGRAGEGARGALSRRAAHRPRASTRCSHTGRVAALARHPGRR